MPNFGSCAEDADVFSDRKPFLFQAPLEKNSALHIYSTFHLENANALTVLSSHLSPLRSCLHGDSIMWFQLQARALYM